VAVAAALVSFATVYAGPAVAAPGVSAGRVTLRLIVHNPPQPGGSATIDVVATGTASLAGFEMVATADPKGATVSGADSSTGSAGKAGFSDLSMSDLDRTAVLAAYAPQGKELAGTVTLGSFYLADVKAARVAVSVSAVRLVGPNGLALPVATPSLTAVVTPLSAGRSADKQPRYEAPAAPWQLPAATGKAVSRAANPDLQSMWENLRLKGGPCSLAGRQLDTNGDGCLDVGDLLRNALVSPTKVPTVALPAQGRPVGPAATGGVASPLVTAASPAATGATFTVDSTSDEWDQNVGNGICRTASNVCSLRAAIQEANAAPGPNTIAFAIPGAGVHTIQLTKTLPSLNDASGGTLIDGYTQPGSSVNTDPLLDNAQIMVEVRGNGATGDGTTSGFDALPVTSSFNTIRGLSMYNSRRELWIHGTGATHNTVVGDFVGTDSTGTFVTPAIALEAIGIKIENDAPYNNIGTSDTTQPPAPADRNVVSGNGRQGIGLWHSKTDFSVIVNNIVGLSPDGTRRVPNRKHGIDLNFGASQVQIGGTGPGERNLVSGNDGDGIEISHTNLTTQNDVSGNYVGSEVTGNAAPAYAANSNTGIYLEDGVTGNTVENNVVVNSVLGGIETITAGGTNGPTTQNVIKNNLVGIGVNGAALPNQQFGILADGDHNTYGPGNVVRFNKGPGIAIDSTTSVGNKITQNVIADNTGLSIDLSPVGQVNPNDPGDTDTGANDGLNYPEPLTTTPTAISGTACAGCSVEVYTTGTPTGYGPARSYVGTASADPTTGDFTLPITLPGGTALSAVAIAPNGDTSEMAPNVTVATANQPPTIDAGPDITVDPSSSTQLQATVSDPDGTTDTVTWDLDGNGTFETTGNPVTFVAPATGPAQITVTAKATDPGGLTATDSLIVTVNAATVNPTPPVARMVVPNEVDAGTPISISMDQPDRSNLVYAFDCGSGFGTASSTATATCPSGAGPTAAIRSQVTDPAEGLSTTYSAVVIVHPNLLANGGFDASSAFPPSGWTGVNNLRYVTSPVHSGSQAVSSPATGTSTASLTQSYTTPFDKTRYSLGAWVNVPSDGTGSVSLVMRWYDANNTNFATSTIATISDPTNGWVNLSKSLTPLRAGATRVSIQVVWNTNGRAIAVDDVVLRHDNDILNGEFDLDANADGSPDSWALQSRFTQSSDVAHATAFSGKSTGDGGAFQEFQRLFSVNAGGNYTVNGWIDVPANTCTFTLKIQIRWRDATAQTTLAITPVATYNGTAAAPFTTPGWQQFSASATAPAGAAIADLEYVYSSGFTAVSYIDSIAMTQS
jgi:CSLREA domain-containing protein